MRKIFFTILSLLLTVNLYSQSGERESQLRLWAAMKDNNKEVFDVELKVMSGNLHKQYPTHERYADDACNDYNYTALGYAVHLGREYFVKEILAQEILAKKHLPTNVTDLIHKGNHFTALDIAIAEGAGNMVSLLIDKYDANTVYHEGNAGPLILACRTNAPYIIKLLLENGADINKAGKVQLAKYNCDNWRRNEETFQDDDEIITTYPIHELLKAGGSFYYLRDIFAKHPINLTNVDSKKRTAIELAKEMKEFYDQLFVKVINAYWEGQDRYVENDTEEDNEFTENSEEYDGNPFITSLENTVIIAQNNIDAIEAWMQGKNPYKEDSKEE